MPISFKSLSGSARWERVVRITSTQNFTVPADVTQLEVLLAAGGGGGGGSGSWPGGGGAGSARYEFLTVTPGSTHTVTIGGGGAHQAAGSASSFGSLLSAPGGARGSETSPNFGIPAHGQGVGGSGGAGGRQTGSTTDNWAFIAHATPGMWGIAGGGGGGGWLGGGPSHGGAGNGGSALSNSGGGGGGFAAGGSGVCIIKYWSAL